MKDNRSGRGRMAGARAAFAILFTALSAFVCVSGYAAQLNIMPLKDVKPGMKGIGRTVFKGSAISDFPVEVLGVVPGAGPGGCNLILIKVSGKLVQDNGGVAMGMSGSPIYINKKLIGALSTAFPDESHTLAGVTPIEDMLAEVEYLETPAKTSLAPPIEFEGKTFGSITYSSARRHDDGALYAKTAVAPISIRGVNKRSYLALKSFFAASGMDVLPFTGATAASTAATPQKPVATSGLRPGSSVAVQLARGDLDISAVGTVTVVDGNKVLIFGHPFFSKGKVEYLLSDASVITIVRDQQAPYKLSTTGEKRGVINQDRGKSLLGYIGKFPEMLPVKITVEDKDINRRQSFSVEVAPDDDLIPNLIVAVMLNALDKSIDRIGPGAAEIKFTINTKGLDTEIERKNTFYSSFDITAESLSELMVALEMIRGNHYKDVKITGLEATVLVDSSRSTASIVEAELFDPANPGKAKETDKKDKPAADEKKSGGADDKQAEDHVKAEESAAPAGADGDEGAAIVEEDYDTADGAGMAADTEDEASEPATGAGEVSASGSLTDSAKKENSSSAFGSILGKGGRGKTKKLPKVYPGQKLCLNVTLLPYRKENIERKLYLKVPKDITSGAAIIDIYSGMKYQRSMGGLEQMISVIADSTKPGARDQGAGEDGSGSGKKAKKKTLEDIFRNFLDRDKNNELVATITSLSAAPKDDEEDDYSDRPSSGPGDQEPDIMADDDFEPLSKDRAKKLTEFVLTGSTSIRVKVESKADRTAVKSGKIKKSRISALEDNGEKDDGKKDGKKEGKK